MPRKDPHTHALSGVWAIRLPMSILLETQAFSQRRPGLALPRILPEGVAQGWAQVCLLGAHFRKLRAPPRTCAQRRAPAQNQLSQARRAVGEPRAQPHWRAPSGQQGALGGRGARKGKSGLGNAGAGFPSSDVGLEFDSGLGGPSTLRAPPPGGSGGGARQAPACRARGSARAQSAVCVASSTPRGGGLAPTYLVGLLSLLYRKQARWLPQSFPSCCVCPRSPSSLPGKPLRFRILAPRPILSPPHKRPISPTDADCPTAGQRAGRVPELALDDGGSLSGCLSCRVHTRSSRKGKPAEVMHPALPGFSGWEVPQVSSREASITEEDPEEQRPVGGPRAGAEEAGGQQHLDCCFLDFPHLSDRPWWLPLGGGLTQLLQVRKLQQVRG